MSLTADQAQGFISFLFNDRKLDRSRDATIRSQVKTFFLFFQNRDFSRQSFNEFIEELIKKGDALTTINTYIALAKNFDRFLGTVHLADYRYFSCEKKMIEVLTPSEIKAIAETKIQYAKKKKYLNALYRSLIYLLATTGCRIEEALTLTKKDLLHDPPAVIFRHTKNNEDRAVPIAGWLYRDMMALSPTVDLVFVSYRSAKIAPGVVNLDLKKRAEKVNIKKHVYCHLFRHSYITTMLEAGVDISDVARIVGHQDLRSTMHYKHNLLSHYQRIIYLHPLLKEKIDFTTLTRKIKAMITLYMESTRFSLSIHDTRKKLLIEIAEM